MDFKKVQLKTSVNLCSMVFYGDVDLYLHFRGAFDRSIFSVKFEGEGTISVGYVMEKVVLKLIDGNSSERIADILYLAISALNNLVSLSVFHIVKFNNLLRSLVFCNFFRHKVLLVAAVLSVRQAK